MPNGDFLILPTGIQFFPIVAKCKKPFIHPPVIKLSYSNKIEDKLIKIPLMYSLFFSPLTKVFEKPEKFTSFKEISVLGFKILNLNKNIFLHGKTFTQVFDDPNGIFLAFNTPCGPGCMKMIQNKESVHIFVKAEKKKLANIILNIVTMQLESIESLS